MTALTPTRTLTTTTPLSTSTIHSSSPITFTPLNPPYNTLLAGTIFTTHTFPTILSNEDDMKRHETYVPHGIGVKNGVVAVMNKFLPGAECPGHRTETIDFGVMVEGELEVLLEDGGRKRFGRGDVVVQRGTYHGWRNPSMENETLVFFVAVGAEAVVVDGEVLGEDLKNLGM
ncbi:uncharacterized protein DFL_004563 [Arthrobotrys flagrans]|uniref:Cupin type-2 domain-containing protein n=1 Tax=Arthrobotrys flagrans TaxID=97331 RepID=A0A437A598_ARTFL|nr:hypothetical protein DFL_004563 [Arthrobotrys flagrans]